MVRWTSTATVLVLLACSCTARYHHMGYTMVHHDDPVESNSTEVAEVKTETARQAPYSYYYIGRKLWYIPLWFSLYFVIYVAALIIRAIARHKVTFPERLPSARSLQSRLDRDTFEVTSGIAAASSRYM